MRKNVASQVVGAQLVSATDGSAFTGAVTCYVTGDAGTQAAGSVGSGACTHEGNGFHTYAPAQAETNYNHVAFTFTGTGAVPVTVQVYTVSYDPHDTADLGLTSLDATISSRASQASVDAIAGYVDTEMGAVKAVTDKLDTALELDGATYRYTTNALEQAPSGGGAADWTADEKTVIKAVLGIPASGTTPDDPTTGILDTIRDKTALIPASPAAVGSAMTLANNAITSAAINDGAITDAKFTTPAETAGRPTTILAMARRIFEWHANKRVRDRAASPHTVELRNSADSATLETQEQSTTSGIDTQTQGV